MIEMCQQGEMMNQNIMVLSGLSTDTKPTTWNGITPPQMSIFIELDTKTVFLFDKANSLWRKWTQIIEDSNNG